MDVFDALRELRNGRYVERTKNGFVNRTILALRGETIVPANESETSANGCYIGAFIRECADDVFEVKPIPVYKYPNAGEIIHAGGNQYLILTVSESRNRIIIALPSGALEKLTAKEFSEWLERIKDEKTINH